MNHQNHIEAVRALYSSYERPLLSQLAMLHRVTVRDFASIFGISKSHADDILNHRKLPSLELAFRIARYWERVTVDDLFGWRVDDDGTRAPLMMEIDGQTMRLTDSNTLYSSLEMLYQIEQKRQRKMEAQDEPDSLHNIRRADSTGEREGVCDAGVEERGKAAGDHNGG